MALYGDTSDLDRLEYLNCCGCAEKVLPERDSYRTTLPDGTVSSSIGGGLQKQAVQFFNAPTVVTCTYNADYIKGQWLDNFFRVNNGVPFIAWLLDDGMLEEYVVQCNTRPRKTADGVNNATYNVTYELQPNIYDECFLGARLSLGGLATQETFNALADMANPTFPI